MATCDSCRWFKDPKRIDNADLLSGRCDHPVVRMLNNAQKGVPAAVKRSGYVSSHRIGERCKEHEQRERQ